MARPVASYRRIAWTATAIAWLVSVGIAAALLVVADHLDVHLVMLWLILLLGMSSVAVILDAIERVLPDVAARAFAAGMEIGRPREPVEDNDPTVRRLPRGSRT